MSIVIGGAGYCGFGQLGGRTRRAPGRLGSGVGGGLGRRHAVVVVVVVVAVVDLLPGLKSRTDTPTTTNTAMPMVTNRRMVLLRLATFCSASRRACLPAF